MKSCKSTLLKSPVLCEDCKRVFVYRLYQEYANKPLCADCRTPHNAIVARREFNAAGKGYVGIVPEVSS